jgi:hypothetical protein
MMKDALLNRGAMKLDNTRVEGGRVYLHGNLIATVEPHRIELFDCGWRTPTTKDRLNAILRAFGVGVSIRSRGGEWMIEPFSTLDIWPETWQGSKVFEGYFFD